MSLILGGILNSTVAILCTKLRDYTADRLDEGDVTDTEYRQIAVREIDDIKSKLDRLSRKDLHASLGYFKQGVTRLYISFEETSKFFEEPSPTKSESDEPSASKAEVEDEFDDSVSLSVEQFPIAEVKCDALEAVVELSDIISSFKLASQERYKLAKESFKEAKRLATEAFSNVGLSFEDRLTACKLRIASRVLECLEDPDAAVVDCLLYLKELQDLPEVQAMFTAWQGSDRGVAFRLRAGFNKKKRNLNVESIHVINGLLIDLAMRFTRLTIGCLKWPTIKTGGEYITRFCTTQG